MSDEYDVYYGPEKHGLEKIAEVDYSSGSYEFDIRCVWKHTASGKYYMARDSGCSCPGTFESYTSIDKLSPFNLDEIENEIKSQKAGGSYECSDTSNFLKIVRDIKCQ